ncbi:MAG TPA: hypothetical protein VH253_19750 [Phycisphaerae bacterium]|nr:hypothetical protein [Phycisphaerae bacterium]
MADVTRRDDELKNDAGMQGRVKEEKKAEEQDRMRDAGSAEARAVRGIDAGPRGEPGDRRAVESPDKKLEQVSSYTGSLANGPQKTSGSEGRKSSEAGGQLEGDEGVVEQEKDPLE